MKPTLVEALNGRDSLPEEWWKSIGPTPSANALGAKGCLISESHFQFGPILKNKIRNQSAP